MQRLVSCPGDGGCVACDVGNAFFLTDSLLYAVSCADPHAYAADVDADGYLDALAHADRAAANSYADGDPHADAHACTDDASCAAPPPPPDLGAYPGAYRVISRPGILDTYAGTEYPHPRRSDYRGAAGQRSTTGLE